MDVEHDAGYVIGRARANPTDIDGYDLEHFARFYSYFLNVRRGEYQDGDDVYAPVNPWYAAGVLSFLSTQGGMLTTMFHAPDLDTSSEVANFRRLLEVFAQFNNAGWIEFDTLGALGEMIVPNCDVVAGAGDGSDERLRYRFTDNYDGRLRPGSAALDAGDGSVWIGVPNVTDQRGVPITDSFGDLVAPGGRVDIGPFEWSPTGVTPATWLHYDRLGRVKQNREEFN
jgi:hypothetical protein